MTKMKTAADLTREQRERNEALAQALESGNYIQGRSKLRSTFYGDVRLCCLGVAYDLHAVAGLGSWNDNFYSPDNRGVAGSSTVAPIPVSQWYGWDSCNPDLYDEEGNQTSAVGLNDDFGFDFKAIAAAFRRTYVTTEAIAEVAASAK